MNIFRQSPPGHALAPYGPILLGCVLALALTACGQRGPLFLPDSQSGARPAGGEPADGQSQDDPRQDETERDDDGSAPQVRQP